MAADAESERDDSRQHETSDEIGPGPEHGSSMGDERHCPLCGGPAKQTWRDVSTFVVALMFAPVLFFMAMGGGGRIFAILGLVSGAIAVLSFWAMPALGALAVVAQPRCCSCGRRLQTGFDDSQRPSAAPLPKWPAIVGSGILLAILAVSLLWLRTAPGLETSVMGARPYLWVILAGFALGLGLLVQAMVWRRWRARIAGTGREGCLLLLATFVTGAGWLALTACDYYYLGRKYDPVKRAPQVLDRGGLAALPSSARDVKVYSWAFMLSGQFDLRFAAEPNVIEDFLANSPGLGGATCRMYSHQRMLLRGSPYIEHRGRQDERGNHILPLEQNMPSWYEQELRGPGRRYEISWYDGKYEGELLIDDEKHTVYVHLDRL